MTPTTADRIIDLWATPFLYYAPDGHERYRDRLAAIASQAPGTDILRSDDPAADWLRTQIDEAATAFLARWAEADVGAFAIEGRAAVRGHGDYQPLCNHPDAYLSGIYCVTVPEGLRDGHHRFDTDSNVVSFYDPRFAMNMGAIANDPNIDIEKHVRPKPGVLIAWPSYVDYFIHPNLSPEKQVTVHFNIVLGDRP